MPISLNNLASKVVAANRRVVFLISLALILSAAAFAQTTSTANILMLPNGSPQTCETPEGAQTQACNGFVPGNAPFVLSIKAVNANTTTYRYIVVATMPDGTTRVVSGQIGRADDVSGYTSTSVTLGCDPVAVDTTVVEAAAGGISIEVAFLTTRGAGSSAARPRPSPQTGPPRSIPGTHPRTLPAQKNVRTAGFNPDMNQ